MFSSSLLLFWQFAKDSFRPIVAVDLNIKLHLGTKEAAAKLAF